METTADSADPRVQAWSPVCQAIALLLGPYAEVVLHDVARDRMLAVWNPMSRRGPGDPRCWVSWTGSTHRPATFRAVREAAGGRAAALVGQRGAAGHPGKAVGRAVRQPRPHAAGPGAALLAGFAAPTETRPEALFEQDWTERVHQIIGSYVRTCGRPLERLAREDRLSILAELDQAGVFAVRRAVPFVAGALEVSRSSLYALLAELKDEEERLVTRLPDFRLETYFSRWEFTARHHLTASDAQTMTLAELLALADEQAAARLGDAVPGLHRDLRRPGPARRRSRPPTSTRTPTTCSASPAPRRRCIWRCRSCSDPATTRW